MADDGTYVTIASVRRTCGIGSDVINDDDVSSTITECEPQIIRTFNTHFTPKEIIEARDGNSTYQMILNQNPVMAVRDLYINGTQEDTAHLKVYKGSGKIELANDATASTFIYGSQKVVIKYVVGFLEDSTTDTATTAASVAGTSVALAVSASTDFSADDWVEIRGMDGNIESAQVSATDTAEITVDQLVYAHVSGSTVVKLQVNEVFKKLMNIACSIALVARIVGQSYTDIVGYGLGEFRIQKGEPYTQWRETALQLTRERDRLLKMIKPRPAVM